MSTQPTDQTWRDKITRAAVAGLIYGIARALTAWILDHLAAPI